MRRLLVVVAVVALALPAAGSALRARTQAQGLTIGGIKAVFDEARRETTYSVVGIADSDPSATCCTYKWGLHLSPVDTTKPVDKGCDNHGVDTGEEATFTWHHGNIGDPVSDDGCSHEALGIYGHQGFVIVTVADDEGHFCITHYLGTIGSDAAEAAGTRPAGRVTCATSHSDSPAHGTTCRCALMTGRILPAATKELPLRKHETLRLQLAFHWVLNCTGGKGGCAASLGLDRLHHAPNAAQHDPGYITQIEIMSGKGQKSERGDVHFLCRGKCAKLTEGTFEIELSSYSRGLDALNRSGDSLPIVLSRSCQGHRLKPLRLSVAFDSAGKLDLAHSKLR
jgi:hypothetical protein